MTRTAVVAGVGPTIGTAVARRFHEAGMNVGLFARSRAVIDALEDELGEGALAVRVDVTDTDSVRNGFDRVREAFGPVEVLVLNATAGGGNPVEDATLDRFEEIWRVRAYGSFACVKAAREELESRNGTVVFSGTTFATDAAPGQVEWGSAAAATRGLARTLDDALDGVQVAYVRIGSAVSPSGDGWDGAVSADEVAETYLSLVEQDGAVSRDLVLR